LSCFFVHCSGCCVFLWFVVGCHRSGAVVALTMSAGLIVAKAPFPHLLRSPPPTLLVLPRLQWDGAVFWRRNARRPRLVRPDLLFSSCLLILVHPSLSPVWFLFCSF
ncbi:unnamed protein product, partial [Ectocarpus fasciculatus]